MTKTVGMKAVTKRLQNYRGSFGFVHGYTLQSFGGFELRRMTRNGGLSLPDSLGFAIQLPELVRVFHL